jgi:hypothetical protein
VDGVGGLPQPPFCPPHRTRVYTALSGLLPGY